MKNILHAAVLLFCISVLSAANPDMTQADDIPAFMIGSSYYPEQWPESRWEEDFKKMNEIGFNVVRMGEFAWSHFEPSPGKFEFEWMDKAISLAAEHGIKVILCTPTASMPPWLITDHPDVLSGDADGPYDQGVRKGHNTNSNNLILASDRIVTAMAEHFGNNPDVIGWQLDNEPGYPFMMHDELTRKAFDEWLRRRYSSIEELNDAWWNAFWSMEYRDWSEIPLPPLNRADGIANPSHQIEYRRFFSDSFLSFLKRQEEILRAHVGDRFIFTNWPNTSWSLNLYDASRFLDFHGWDNYSPEPGMGDYRLQYFSGMHHDLCRNAVENQTFIVSEQPAQALSSSVPEAIRLKTYTDIAHGAKGTIFFEWRSPLGSSEYGYVSVLQLDGTFGPSKDQLVRMRKELDRLIPRLENTKVKADLALVYSYDNEWDQGWWIKGSSDGYDKEAERYYTGMKILKRNIDVISENADLRKYKLLVAPGLDILSPGKFEKFRSYVRNGGVLVINGNAGSKDVYNKFYEMNTPGLFKEMAGVEIPWLKDIIRGRDKFDFSVHFAGSDTNFEPRTFMKNISLSGAEALAWFSGGHLDDKPAVTINKYGKGYLVYVGTNSLNPAFYENIFKSLDRQFHYNPLLDVPENVEVVTRENDQNRFIFCLNQADQEARFSLDSPMHEVITDQDLKGDIVIPPLDVRIFVVPE